MRVNEPSDAALAGAEREGSTGSSHVAPNALASTVRVQRLPRDVRQSLPREVRQSLPREVRQSPPRDVRQSLPSEVRPPRRDPPPPLHRSLPPPFLTERYEDARFIGEGGMGTVYHVMDPRLGRPVALKLLKAG